MRSKKKVWWRRIKFRKRKSSPSSCHQKPNPYLHRWCTLDISQHLHHPIHLSFELPELYSLQDIDLHQPPVGDINNPIEIINNDTDNATSVYNMTPEARQSTPSDEKKKKWQWVTNYSLSQNITDYQQHWSEWSLFPEHSHFLSMAIWTALHSMTLQHRITWPKAIQISI